MQQHAECVDVGAHVDASPERLYLIDANGRVAYVGGKGPAKFSPDELERAIERLLEDDER